ncbi:odorant receptor 4-like [Sitodiplosis mosellana]|uniref:odorant receptor 4-like n=1 Tax=Sitodiplosis mosellana TaxID=263140 RepID=UPI002444F189|nr:odorant receptor 4-like [Sitodiplosis mosellana]
MKPLATGQRVLTWLSVCPPDESTSKCQKQVYIICSVLVLVANVIGFVTSVAYVHRFVSIDLEKSLCSMLQICAMGCVSYAYILMFVLRHKVTAFLGHLSQIYKQYANEDTFRYLAEANNKSEWLWKFYFKYLLGGFLSCNVFSTIALAIVCWLTFGKLDTDYLHIPYLVIWPWNQHTVMGYCVEICADIICGFCYFFYNGIVLLMFISICWHHRAFCQIIGHLVRKLDQRDTSQNDKVLLSKLIRSHIQFKVLFEQSSQIYSSYILVQLICSMGALACSVFQLDMAIKHIDLGLYMAIVNISAGAYNLFLYCYFGKMVTDNFAKISEYLYDIKWYELPVELQKYIILAIQNAQLPLHYHGFKVAILNLETFCAMIRAVFSYYMMFKTLTTG